MFRRIDQIIPLPKDGLPCAKSKPSAPPPHARRGSRALPQHLAQVATYLALAQVRIPKGPPLAELAWIDIDSGTVQIQTLEEKDPSRFVDQLDALIPFLEDRRKARGRLRAATLKAPFTTLREGQAEFRSALEAAALAAPTLLLEAPTGFGKTGLVLEHALQSLLDSVHERLIF